ncbi:hypothetical protein BVY03_05125, partial [bacterium K02(2017)]
SKNSSKTGVAKITDNHFTAKTLEGKTVDSKNFNGNKVLLGYFSYKHKDAASMIMALNKLKAYQDKNNYKIYLVSIDYGQANQVKEFLNNLGVDLPVILEDSNLALAEKYKVEYEVSMVGLNPKLEISFSLKKYTYGSDPAGEKIFIDNLKEILSIKDYDDNKPHFGIYPAAKDFTAKDANGTEIKLSSLQGKVVQIIFFSPKCPHCQQEMKFLRDKIYPVYHEKGFEVLAVSAMALNGEAKQLYDSFKFKWPVIEDADRKIRDLFSKERAVPENFMINKEGRVAWYATGYSRKKNNTYEMMIQGLLGQEVKNLVSTKHFSGVDDCQSCHQKEYVSWSVSKHAGAWHSLEIKGETNNKDCVGCHTLGFNDPKGFKAVKNNKTGKDQIRVAPWFQNVTCENCHGLGGPHNAENKAKNLMAKENLSNMCSSCHTKEWSPNFDFEKALLKVNHSDSQAVMGMSKAERIKKFEE